MDTLLQTTLTSLSTHLSTLLSSLTDYNPSIPATRSLLSASTDLNTTLHILATHQRNVRRIAALREEIKAQEGGVRSCLEGLAGVRGELIMDGLGRREEGGGDGDEGEKGRRRRDMVSYEDVLDYAKRIARFTSVPGGVGMMVRPGADTIATTTTVVKAEGEHDGGAAAAVTEQVSEGKGIASLEEYEKQWLDPWTGVQFTPWPGEEVLKRGGLGEIQALVERGVDPAGVRGEGREGNAEGEKEEEEEAMEVKAGGAGQAQMMTMMRAQKKEEQKPRVFGGLDLYDPDEEDG